MPVRRATRLLRRGAVTALLAACALVVACGNGTSAVAPRLPRLQGPASAPPSHEIMLRNEVWEADDVLDAAFGGPTGVKVTTSGREKLFEHPQGTLSLKPSGEVVVARQPSPDRLALRELSERDAVLIASRFAGRLRGIPADAMPPRVERHEVYGGPVYVVTWTRRLEGMPMAGRFDVIRAIVGSHGVLEFTRRWHLAAATGRPVRSLAGDDLLARLRSGETSSDIPAPLLNDAELEPVHFFASEASETAVSEPAYRVRLADGAEFFFRGENGRPLGLDREEVVRRFSHSENGKSRVTDVVRKGAMWEVSVEMTPASGREVRGSYLVDALSGEPLPSGTPSF